MWGGDFDFTVQPARQQHPVQVLHGLEQCLGVQVIISVVSSQVLVAHGNCDDRGGRNEGGDAGGEPLISGGSGGAYVGDVVVFNGNDEVNAGVGKGLEDLRVGVVDLDFVNKGGLEELGYSLGGREVVSEGAVVNSDGGNFVN